jgi:hypothetical protein
LNDASLKNSARAIKQGQAAAQVVNSPYRVTNDAERRYRLEHPWARTATSDAPNQATCTVKDADLLIAPFEDVNVAIGVNVDSLGAGKPDVRVVGVAKSKILHQRQLRSGVYINKADTRRIRATTPDT